jgi:hypothetical protein
MLMLGLPILTRSRVLLFTRIQSAGCSCGQSSRFTRIFCTASPNIGQLLYFQTPLHFFSKINKICDHGRNMLTDSFLSKSWYARSYAVCSLSFFIFLYLDKNKRRKNTTLCWTRTSKSLQRPSSSSCSQRGSPHSIKQLT